MSNSSIGHSGSFGSFGTQSSYPFGQNQGIQSLNPFRPNDKDMAVKTTFGQSSSFCKQPPLPPGGMAAAPPIQGGGVIGNHPPVGFAGVSTAPGGFSGDATRGNPFGQNNKNKSHNNSSTTFGSMQFKQNGDSSALTSGGASTTFGSASNATVKPKNRGSEFGGSKQQNPAPAFSGNNNTTFARYNNGISGEHATFGAPLPNRGERKDAFLQQSNGFGFANASASTPLTSQTSTFGSQASSVRVRKKPISSKKTPVVAHEKNPFAAASNNKTSNAPTIHTTFGSAAGKTKLKPSSALRKPNAADGDVPFTTFGGVNEFQQNSIPNVDSGASVGSFSNSNKLASVETRMGSTKTSSFGQSKRVQEFNTMTKHDANPFNGQQMMARYNLSGDTIGAPKVPKVSPSKEKQGKKRQARAKKKTSSRDNEEALLDPLPPTTSFSKDESSKAQLSAATNLDGLCADMCSPAERELHLRVDELSVFEKCFPDQPGTERDMIIKRFQRSSADHKLDIPEEIRPPGVLRRTQLYIEQAIMDLDQQGFDPRFQTLRVPEPIELYNFCWDRFRMIRKDFVLQNYRGGGGRVHPIALDIHERIARYHVLSEHELIETPSFVAQQNMEQLGQTLKSLNELYDESHKVGDPAYLSPFEAECRAYFILCTLDNGRGMDVLKYVKDLPQQILESNHIKFAMRVFVARHTGDYFQFFSLLRQATYLQSCLLFRYIPNVRSSALLRMNRAFRSQTYPLEDLVELLCFDDMEHAYQVCQEHQLSISGMPNCGNDSAVTLKFGGEFETDVQLRRNNTPLKIRSSKLYVGMKQGNYLRRDICRGVTEYNRDEYPALSKLIRETELGERARLYPDRPMYEDDYSFFMDYSEGGFRPSSTSTQQRQPSDVDHHKKHDLGLIAQRKQELEQKKQLMLERMRELEQAKEEKARSDSAKKAAAEEAAKREEQARLDIEAQRQQQQVEAQLVERKRQRELEEQRIRAELAAREAERQRVAAQKQVEAMKRKAAEEECRRQREEEARIRQKAAQEAERRRQQELAEMQARQAHQAALEAERQAILAKERARMKKERRAEKQRLAVLRLRMHIWQKYVQVSRNGSGPIQIDSSKLRLDRPHHKAKESIHWLFSGAVGVSDIMTGTKRQVRSPRPEKQVSPLDSNVSALWSSDDILNLVCGPLCQQNPGIPLISWKLVIADLQDEAFSPFGFWSAVRTGTQSVSFPEHDCYHVDQSTSDTNQGIAVCSRYLDATFALHNTREIQREKLAATSAILLPFDLTKMQISDSCCSWEQRVGELFSSLNSSCRVIVVALGLASVETNPSQESLVTTLRSCMERVQSRFASLVVQASVELVDADNYLADKFGQVLKKMATMSPSVHQFKSVDLKDFLESSVKAMMNQVQSSVALQRNICALFPRISDDILTSGIMDLVYPPPELHFAIMEPPRGWNSQEKRHEIRKILTALEATHMAIVTLPLTRDETCDVYFKKVEDFIDRLFATYPGATTVSTYELKKRIYTALLPIHERLIQGDKAELVSPQDADALLPWRKIFGEIYSTFFETLSEITIYYSTDWEHRFGARVSSLLDAAMHSPVSQRLNLNGQASKQDGSVVKRPVQVSMKSVRQSFGLWNAVDESAQNYRVMGAMKRLRVEIETEQAAACQYQRMLRQALNRWDK